MLIAAADVGSIKNNNFAWSTDDVTAGRRAEGVHIAELAALVDRTLKRGDRVALGFECPLFVPVPDEPALLGRQRDGENGRPWGVMAGAYTLAVGLVELSWVLGQLGPVGTTVLPTRWSDEVPLLLWEAFVSGPYKPEPAEGISAHINDARAAVRGFASFGPDVPASGRITAGAHRCVNLGVSAALASGSRIDPAELTAPALVVDGRGDVLD